MSDDGNDPEDPKPSLGHYQVGYRKPPREYQFRLGQSGNSAGRPRAGVQAVNLFASVDRALKKRISVLDGGQKRKVRARDALITQLLQAALRGDKSARKELLKLAEKADLARASGEGLQELKIIVEGGLPDKD